METEDEEEESDEENSFEDMRKLQAVTSVKKMKQEKLSPNSTPSNKKQGTPNQNTPKKLENTPAGNKTPEGSKKGTPNSKFSTPEQSQKPKTPSSVGHTPMKFLSKGGVMIEELKVGDGSAVKSGKMVC